jgi:hypothetical protein
MITSDITDGQLTWRSTARPCAEAMLLAELADVITTTDAPRAGFDGCWQSVQRQCGP